LAIVISFSACGFRSIPQSKNNVEATAADLLNKYKRRAELVPAVVAVVKGFATHEKDTLDAVMRARAKATQMIAAGDITAQSEASLHELTRFSAAQENLTQALGKLTMRLENYPDLKANRTFLSLNDQLVGSENRIMWARKKHIAAIRQFNDLISTPPSSWTNAIFVHEKKLAQWASSHDDLNVTPNVDL